MADLTNPYGTQPKKPVQQVGLAQALQQGSGDLYAAPATTAAPKPSVTTVAAPAKTPTAMQGNGQIPPPSAPAPAPQPAPAPAPAPALPAGATDIGNGLVRFADGVVLPKNHPAYAAKLAGPVAAPAPTQPGPMVANPATGTVTHAPAPAAAPMTPAQAAAAGLNWVPPDHPSYGKPGFVGSTPASGGAPAAAPGAPASGAPAAFGAPQTTQDQIYSLMTDLLKNPYSMSDQTVNQLKEVNKEEATGLAQQLAHKAKLDAAARGVSFSGNEAVRQEKIGEAMNSDIIKQNRAVDLQKAMQDRSDLMGALGMASDYTKQAQGNYFQDKSLGLQDKLGSAGISLDSQRLSEQKRQFDLAQQLALKQFLENQRQFNNQIGFNYNQLDQNGQLATLGNLFGRT